MSTELVKRFCIEIKKDYSLYQMFLNGIWYPNYEEYHLFLNKQNKNNRSFAHTIEHFHLIKKEDAILETVANEEYAISEFLEKPSMVLESHYGKVKGSSIVLPDLNYQTCYISNGVYQETESMIHRLTNFGNFIVGVCDNKDSVFFKDNKERLEKIEEGLRKRKVKIKVLKRQEHRDTTYLICHRRDTL